MRHGNERIVCIAVDLESHSAGPFSEQLHLDPAARVALETDSIEDVFGLDELIFLLGREHARLRPAHKIGSPLQL